MADLKHEIAQERPFSSLEEEALLNLMRTADCINRAFHLQIRTWGVTSTQYNVLRILRGAHPAALTCSDIGSRMIATDPDITRLLGRLKALKLIRQNRDRHDRRNAMGNAAGTLKAGNREQAPAGGYFTFSSRSGRLRNQS